MRTPQLSRTKQPSSNRGAYRVGALVCCIVGLQILAPLMRAHPSHGETVVKSGAAALAETILHEHPYLLAPEHRAALEAWVLEVAGVARDPRLAEGPHEATVHRSE